MKVFLLIIAVLFLSIAADAQTPMSAATAAEQARIKPLLDNLKKVQEPFVAKRDALPESKAVKDAQAAVTAAQANLEKALAAQNKVAIELPEFDSVKVAEAKLLDEAYRILAEHKLSSRDFRPILNDKGELAFVRIEPIPKP